MATFIDIYCQRVILHVIISLGILDWIKNCDESFVFSIFCKLGRNFSNVHLRMRLIAGPGGYMYF